MRYILRAGQGKLVTAWHGLHDDIVLLHAVSLEFGDGSSDERVNDLLVPSRVYNGHAQRRAIEVCGRRGRTFD